MNRVALFNEAKSLMSITRWRDAAEILKSVPQEGGSLCALATCYANLGEFDKLKELANQLDGSSFKQRNHVTYGLSFIGKPAPKQGNYVFVSGSPRSGTTSFGKLLNRHPAVAIYTERYVPYLGYHPEMFTEAVLYRSNENHVHAAKHAALRKKLRTCEWVGDKRPNFAYGLPFTLRNFSPNSFRIFFILRDPYQIVWSYVNIAKKRHFRSYDPVALACAEINANNRLTLEFYSNTKVLEYDRIYSAADVTLEAFSCLGLAYTKEIETQIADYLTKSTRLLNKSREIPDDIRHQVSCNIDWRAYEELKSLAKS